MNIGGVFTISLDCEGLWGLADSPSSWKERRITRASLDVAYAFLLKVLAENQTLATAAFVSSFAAERHTLREYTNYFERLSLLQPIWFEELLPRLKSTAASSMDGLEGHQYWRSFFQAGHEMAWHGATHMSLSETTSADAVQIELELANELHAALGHHPSTLVFPRNRVGNLRKLYEAGFRCYRASAGVGLGSRIRGLAREFDISDSGDSATPVIADGWNVSPPGFFLNWPAGPRALVPPAVTVARWRSMLRYAAAHGRWVHMWFHPHNLITEPAMQEVFQAIMAEAGSLIRTGDLQNLTMGDSRQYLRQRR